MEPVRKPTAILVAALLLLLLLPVNGCNSASDAVKAQNAITAVIDIAKADAAVIPVADLPVYTNFVNLAITLDGQLASCNNAISGMTGTAAKYVSCFVAFGTGLTTPAELAQLRILSPATQAKVQLIATGIILALNVAIAFYNGNTVLTPPTIGAASSSTELKDIREIQLEATHFNFALPIPAPLTQVGN
jgi:hypothetical protein